MEDSFQEGAEKEEQQNLENIKSEDNGIEMSEDFDGRVHDGDENEGGELNLGTDVSSRTRLWPWTCCD